MVDLLRAREAPSRVPEAGRALPDLVRVAVLCACYFVTAKLALSMDAVNGFAAAVWPPTGISLFALSTFGYRLWPGITVGAFLVNTSAGAPFLSALGMAVGNTLEAVLGTYLLQRVIGFRPSLGRLRDVLGLVVLVPALTTPVSATIGVTSGWLGGVIPPASFGRAWVTWWLGDMMGDQVLAPLLFTWWACGRAKLPPARLAEAGALLGALAAASWLVFGREPGSGFPMLPYTLFPVLTWAAIRFSQHGAVSAIGVVSAIAIWGTALGYGPFTTGSVNDSLARLQTFMGVMSVTVLVLAANVTERRRLEAALHERAEQLERADRAKDLFLAMLAHELRNPIGAISNALHLLKRWTSAEVRLQRPLEIIERQVHHQARILDDLLDVSRIAQGKIRMHPVRLDLAQLVRDTVADHGQAFDEAGLGLELHGAEEPLWLTGDPTRLAQGLGNLLHNAYKFTDTGGQVTVQVATDRSRDRVTITVRDTGGGIEPKVLPCVFDSFTQADRSLARGQGGLGLGLALVKGLVELHGGEVSAESPGLGCGSTFSILLPVEHAVETLAPEAAAPTGPAREHLRILVVEDNVDAADTLRDLLELHGHEVTVIYSGAGAVETCRRVRPHAVLCDLGLPGMDGYAVAGALRGDPATADARLIAVTGYGQEEDRRRSRAAGFDLHLTKPLDTAELEKILAGVPITT